MSCGTSKRSKWQSGVEYVMLHPDHSPTMHSVNKITRTTKTWKKMPVRPQERWLGQSTTVEQALFSGKHISHLIQGGKAKIKWCYRGLKKGIFCIRQIWERKLLNNLVILKKLKIFFPTRSLKKLCVVKWSTGWNNTALSFFSFLF